MMRIAALLLTCWLAVQLAVAGGYSSSGLPPGGSSGQVQYNSGTGLFAGDSGLSYDAGTDTLTAGKYVAPNLPKLLAADTTAVGNVGAGEDTLIAYNLPAGTMANDGDTIEIDAWGRFANNANNKSLNLYFGSTLLFLTGALAFQNTKWHFHAVVTRVDATNQRAVATFGGDVTLVTATSQITSPTETLSGAVTIKCTGEATANDDIYQEGLVVKYFPNL